jgi:hypothetical protein
VLQLAAGAGGDILVQRSSREDIQCLNAPANPEHWDLRMLQNPLNDGPILCVPLRADAPQFPRRFLTVQCRVQVDAPRNDQPPDRSQSILRDCWVTHRPYAWGTVSLPETAEPSGDE